VFLVHGASFEQLMAIPEMRALARAGGAGLMSPRTVPGDRGPGAYLTLGTGVRSTSPEAQVAIATSRGLGASLADVPAYVAANRGRSTPGLLGSIIESHGIGACLHGRVGGSLLVAMDRRGAVRTGVSTGCGLVVIEV